MERIKILLLEDDKEDFLLLKATLDEADTVWYTIVHVYTLNEAFQKIDQIDFDIILLDLTLPDSSGVETVSKVHQRRPLIPIVVLTGIDDQEVGLKTLRQGAQDYIIKSQLTYDYLYKTIQYALERNRLENFKEEIVSNISHELRTPLTIVRESISQLADELVGPINAKQKEYLEKSITNIDRLKQIINNLLDISKMEAGKIELQKEPFNIVEVAKDVFASFESHMRQKGLQVGVELKNSTENDKIIVFADKEKIIQVLVNLFSNALKFTEKGKIDLVLEMENDIVKCIVVDTGIGIQENQIKTIFTKFIQIDRIHGPGEKGTGLGLAISKNIIEEHGGQMIVESCFHKGTSIGFELPLNVDKGVAI